jgi:hypothetical protein
MKKNMLHVVVFLAFTFLTIQVSAQVFHGSSHNVPQKNLFGNKQPANYKCKFSERPKLASKRYNIMHESLSQHADSKQLKYSCFTPYPENTGILKSKNPSLLTLTNQNFTTMKTSFLSSEWHNKNRRNIYSSLWAFASLNYIYADLIQFMDKNEHLQYHTGTVNGWEMTPEFLAGAAAFMQIAIANVFLPQVIKNDKALRWVQIASGTVMTLVQSATLFADEPTPYYMVFSGLEIAATAYITFDAIRWKPKGVLSKN